MALGDDTTNLVLVITGEDQGASRALLGTAAAAGKAERAVDELGDEMRGTAADAQFLDSRIDELTNNMRALAIEANRTGDTTLFRQFSKDRGELGRLKQMRDVLADMAEAASEVGDSGGAAGSAFFEALSSGLGALPAQLKGAIIISLAGAAVAAAPFIAATVGGAVLAGVSGGTVAAGIALAVGDPRVKQEGAELGSFLATTLREAGGSFGPATLGAIREVRDEAGDLKPLLTDIFDEAATFVVPLTRGVTAFVRNALPGIKDGLEESAPVVAALEAGFARMGATVGRAVDIIGDGSSGAALALGDLFLILDIGITGTAMLIRNLERVYTAGRFVAEALSADVVGMVGIATQAQTADATATEFSETLSDLRAAFRNSGGAAATSTAEIRDWTVAVRDATTQSIGAFDAVTAFEAAIDTAAGAAKHGKDTLDAGTEAGRDNRDALSDLAKKAADAAVKIQELGGSQSDANEIMQRGYDAFVSSARGMGLNRDEAETLAKSLGLINPREVTVTVHTAAAEAAVESIRKRVLALRDRTIRIHGEVFWTSSGLHVPGGTILEGFAAGGAPPVHEPVVVGEEGPEVVSFGQASLIHDAKTSKAILAGASGARMSARTITPATATAGDGGTGGGATVRVVVTTAASADSALADAFVHLVNRGAIALRVDASGLVRAA